MSILRPSLAINIHRPTIFATAFAGFVAVALPLATAQGASEGRWGAFVIVNPTTQPITYDVRWGNASWKRFTIPPNTFRSHADVLDHRNYAQYRYVRFVCTTKGHGTVCREYRLSFYQVRNAARGKPYFFQYNHSGTLIDLFKVTSARDKRAWSQSVDNMLRSGTRRARIPQSWRKRTS